MNSNYHFKRIVLKPYQEIFQLVSRTYLGYRKPAARSGTGPAHRFTFSYANGMLTTTNCFFRT